MLNPIAYYSLWKYGVYVAEFPLRHPNANNARQEHKYWNISGFPKRYSIPIPRQSIELLAAPQFAMEPEAINLKFAIRRPMGPYGPIGPHQPHATLWAHGAPWALPTHNVLAVFDVRSSQLRLKTTIFIMFSQLASVESIILNWRCYWLCEYFGVFPKRYTMHKPWRQELDLNNSFATIFEK